MGWRYTLIVLGAIALAIFFLRFVVFRFQESPKFLIYRGRDEKAVEVLQYIAKFNKKECHITNEDFAALEDDSASGSTGQSKGALIGSKDQRTASWGEKFSVELVRFKYLFSSRSMAIFTVLVWITYMWDYWGFTIAGSFLPTILKRKSVEYGTTTGETYRSYVYIYIFGIPGVLLGTTIYKWVSRQHYFP